LSEFIESELRELDRVEEEATEKLLKKEIDINVGTSNSHNYSLELKRIQSNYYHSYVLAYPHIMGGESTVDIYAKHIFYKDYLERLRERIEQQNNTMLEVGLSLVLTEEIRDKYIKFIKQDQLLKAIDFLESMISEIDGGSAVRKTLTILHSDLSGLKRKKQRGTITDKDLNVERNQIKERLLSFLG
jgi:hypothetical protein